MFTAIKTDEILKISSKAFPALKIVVVSDF
jgi:hypothetical protein